jgi:Tfp pilus assembly protein PilF/predicted Ser/Thr protein kinase
MSVQPSSSSQFLTRAEAGLAPTLPVREVRHGEKQEGPTKIGRFVVLRKLGEGGMGVVYAAYDEELERKVAIKLLRNDFSGLQQSVGQARLLREAQSMARLSHPNVAQIYEVGKFGCAVFIAMEFISGSNLREWLMRAERPWRKILDAYLQAGQGLATAHAAGIVHRDFKPDNVLVGDDGRVRVVDFGLARPGENMVVETIVGPSSAFSGSSGTYLGGELTQVGTFIGTPAYMAPEQLRSEVADAQSDQFSFCVALFESLYGYRPFPGTDTTELKTSVLAGRPLDPPRDSPVPNWVHQVVLRGLAREPEQRHASMLALLHTLAADPAIKRRRRLGIAGVVLASGLAAGGGYSMYELRTQQVGSCDSGEERLAGVWDADTAERVQRALASVATGYAEDVASRTGERLTVYANAWARMHRDACEMHHDGEQSDALYDLRMACLDDRKRALSALTLVLIGADAAVVEKAVQASEHLPLIDRCANASALLAQIPPPEDPGVARAVEDLAVRLAQARARFEVGQYQTALQEIVPIRSEAENVGYQPTIAKALHLEGLIQDVLGEYSAAEKLLLQAAMIADGAGDDDERASAYIDLARTVGLRQARFDEGLRLATLASGTISRLAERDHYEAILETRIGEILLQRRTLDEGAPHIERALELQARVYGENSTGYAAAVNARGTLRFFRADYGEALAEYRRAAAIYEQAYGPAHPLMGKVLNNIGAAELSLFDYAAAQQTYTRALGILRAAHGANHPSLATVYSNLGLIAFAQAEFPRALEEFRRSLAIYEASLPANHPSIGDCLQDLGNGQLVAGQYAEAEATFERALAVYLAAYGPGHEQTTQALAHLGTAQLRGGRRAAAARSFARALAEFRGDPKDPALGRPRAGVGALRLAEGDFVGAVKELDEALALLREGKAPPQELAEVQFALARALWSADRANAERARTLAAGARTGFLGFGAAYRDAAAEVEAWLAGLPPA